MNSLNKTNQRRLSENPLKPHITTELLHSDGRRFEADHFILGSPLDLLSTKRNSPKAEGFIIRWKLDIRYPAATHADKMKIKSRTERSQLKHTFSGFFI